MTLTLTRYSFFKSAQKTQRFTETVPPRERVQGCICNCTEHVVTRPEGDPLEVSQFLESTAGPQCILHNDYFRFKLSSGIECSFSKGRLKILYYSKESLETGFNLVLYRGNKVDVSQLFNGHSPSRIIDLTTIPEDAIWTHACNWGDEKFAIISDPEAEYWRGLFDASAQLLATAAPFLEDLTTEVSSLYEALGRTPVEQLRLELQERFLELIPRIRTTEAYLLNQTFRKEFRKLSATPSN